jgi:hypothetical protein
MEEPKTVVEWAVQVLNTADTDLKAAYTLRALDLWHSVRRLHLFLVKKFHLAHAPCGDPSCSTSRCYRLRVTQGALPKDNVGTGVAPDRPARPEHVELLPPHLAPKRGKGGSLANRIAMVHSLVHIESMV